MLHKHIHTHYLYVEQFFKGDLMDVRDTSLQHYSFNGLRILNALTLALPKSFYLPALIVLNAITQGRKTDSPRRPSQSHKHPTAQVQASLY